MEARLCRHLYFGLPCKIATDGSMQQDERNSFAWTMRLKRTNTLISEQSAQCSLGRNSLGCLRRCFFSRNLLNYYSISTSSTAYIWSNSAASIARLDFISWSKHRGQSPENADIVSLLTDISKELYIDIKIQWIKTHQDNAATTQRLTSIASMNVQADSLASQYLLGQPTTATGGPRRASRHFPTMYASLLIEDRRIHSFTSAQIRSTLKVIITKLISGRNTR